MTRLELLQLIVIFTGILYVMAGVAVVASGRIAHGFAKWVGGPLLMTVGAITLVRSPHVLSWQGRNESFLSWGLEPFVLFFFLYIMWRLERKNCADPQRTMTVFKSRKTDKAPAE